VQNVQLTKSVGIDSYENKVTVYPNPARDVILVETADGTEIADITLYDINGRVVETLRETSLQRSTVNVAGLPAGTYFLHIRTVNGQEIIRKIIHE
jgi:hypothetical protein